MFHIAISLLYLELLQNLFDLLVHPSHPVRVVQEDLRGITGMTRCHNNPLKLQLKIMPFFFSDNTFWIKTGYFLNLILIGN